MIISDNRYGIWSRQIPSVILTHQLSPCLPPVIRIFEYPLGRMIRLMLSRFDHCWIPDHTGPLSISGKLSRTSKRAGGCRYLGHLSRFSPLSPPPAGEGRYRLLAIVSGPEPQRSVFLKIILEQAVRLPIKILVLAGEPDKNYSVRHSDNCRIVSHMPSLLLNHVLCSAEYVICRAGYSSIMDLMVLGKKALLVPTPGQPEQQYLADYLYERRIFPSLPQRGLSLETAIGIMDSFRFAEPVNPAGASIPDLVKEHCQ
jgi:hypothetical protein